MKNKQTLRSPTTSSWPRILGLATLSCALLTPAMANDRHRPRAHHGKHHVTPRPHHARHANHFYDRQHYRSHRFARGHRDIVAPVRLTHTALASYRDFHHGRIYYRPHRHHHAVYRFPVHTNAGWISQPHYYCNGTLFRERERRHHPHFRFSLHF